MLTTKERSYWEAMDYPDSSDDDDVKDGRKFIEEGRDHFGQEL